MPTYALIGATGSTGAAVLHCLLSEPPKDLNLHLLVRSKTKLLRIFEGVEEFTKASIRIFEGSSTDTATLEPCLRDVSVVFMCVGQNESKRGSTLSYDSVLSIVSTLKTLRKLEGSTYNIPTIVQLRSASLNPVLAKQAPKIVHKIVSFCLHYNYADMKSACMILQNAAKEGYLSYVFVDPPTIHDSNGREQSGYKLIHNEKQATALSYADLGAALCEIGLHPESFRNQAIGVTATGRVKETWGVLIGYLANGAKNRVVDMMRSPQLLETSRSTLLAYSNGM